jgi:hypothetical protein
MLLIKRGADIFAGTDPDETPLYHLLFSGRKQ